MSPRTASGRPPRIKREEIVAAALALAEREGLAGVTIAAVAREAGVAPMTLYGHVRNKEDLLDAMAARILAGTGPVDCTGLAWDRAVEEHALAVIAALREYPRSVPGLLTRRLNDAVLVPYVEPVLAHLAEAGFGPGDRARAVRALIALILGTVVRGTELEDAGAPVPGAHPHWDEVAGEMAGLDPVREDRAALRLLLVGLDAGRAAPERAASDR